MRNAASAPSSVAVLASLDSVRVTGNVVSVYLFRRSVRFGLPKGPAKSPLWGIYRTLSGGVCWRSVKCLVESSHSTRRVFLPVLSKLLNRTLRRKTHRRAPISVTLEVAGLQSDVQRGGRYSVETSARFPFLRVTFKGRYAPAAVSHMLGCCPTSAARSRETLWLLRSSSGDSS